MVLAVVALLGATQEQRKPNVLFLFSDDQRADTIHALGNAAIHTPNLDALVDSGFVFRNAYCMGGDIPAVCTPSRYMLLSGLSLFHRNRASADRPHFVRSMKEAGYFTYHHGKKGNSCRILQKEFDVDAYLSNDQKERENGRPGKEIADAAIKFLNDRKKEKPFFMYLAFGNPHDPRVANPEDRARYVDEKLPLPKNYLPVHPFDWGEMTGRDERLAAWPRTPEEIRRHLGDYYGVITHFDREIGRILRALKESGEFERTVIVFSSDHGLALGSHGLMGKQNVYEAGLKPPLIFSGPGVPKGSTAAFAYLYDIFPTVCDLAGISVPDGIDGKTLGPVIRGQAEKVRDAVFLAYRDNQRSARVGDWKLIRYPQINRSQLFNLKDDPDETKDLSGDPAFGAKVKELTAALERLQKEHDDSQPLTTASPRSDTFTPPQGK